MLKTHRGSDLGALRLARELATAPATEPPTAPLEPPYDGLYFAPAPR